MKTDVVYVGRGLLQSSRVSFLCNAGRTDSYAIPLGVLGYVQYGDHIEGVGLIARTQILPSESAQVAELFRPLVVRPFETLKKVFDEIQAADDWGGAFMRIVESPASSLRFEPLRLMKPSVPRDIRHQTDLKPLMAWARGILALELSNQHREPKQAIRAGRETYDVQYKEAA